MTTKPRTAIVERELQEGWPKASPETLDLHSTVYEMKYQFGGEWYLLGRRFASGGWTALVWPNGEFRLAKPAEALAALGESVVKFSTMARSMEFQSALDEVMHRAEQIRKGMQN